MEEICAKHQLFPDSFGMNVTKNLSSRSPSSNGCIDLSQLKGNGPDVPAHGLAGKSPGFGHQLWDLGSYPTSLGLMVLICYKKMINSTSKGVGKTSMIM